MKTAAEWWAEAEREDHGDCACEKCQPALFKARARIVELEAELAKAWEALEAAAGLATTHHDYEGPLGLPERIRALQPPGGKAK